MADTTIPVGVEVRWTSDAARAEMARFENELGQWSRRIAAKSVVVPIKMDLGGATLALDEWEKSVTRDPIKLRVIADDLAIRVQMDALAASFAAKPLVVPVTFQPVGGMPMPTGGGAGAAAMLPAPTSTPSTALAAMAGAAVAGGGGGGTAARGAGGLAGLLSGQGMFTLFRQLMILRTGYEVAAGVGNAGMGWYNSIANEGKGNLRAQVDASATTGEYRKATLGSLDKIPIAGSMVSGLVDRFDRIESGLINKVGDFGRSGNARRGFESNAGYVERMDKEQKAQDDNIKEILRGAELRRHANDEIEKQITSNNRAAATDGIRGTYDRAVAMEGVRRSELAEELKDPKYRRRNGSFTDTAVAFRASELAKIDADATRRRRQESEAYGALADTADVAEAEARGDMAGARRKRFDQEQQTQAKAAFNLGYGQGDYYWRRVAPAQSQAFNRQEVARKAGEDADHSDRMAAAGNRAAEARLRMGGENELAVARHRNELEDQLVTKLQRRAAVELDAVRKVQLTEEAAAEATAAVVVKRANLQDAMIRRTMGLEDIRHSGEMAHLQAEGRGWEATLSDIEARRKRAVTEARGDAEKIGEINKTSAAERALAVRRHDEGIVDARSSVTQLSLQAQGRNYEARQRAIGDEYTRATRDAQGDREGLAVAGERRDAERAVMMRDRRNQIGDLDATTAQRVMRSQGRNQMADYMGVMQGLRTQLRDNVGDRELQGAYIRDTGAQLREMLHPQSHAGYDNSVADYATKLQAQSLDNDGSAREAMERAVRLLESIDRGLREGMPKIHEQLKPTPFGFGNDVIR